MDLKIKNTGMDIFWEDMEKAVQVSFLDWDRLKNRTLFLTGATGLIGTSLVKTLLYANEVYDLGLTILALVRNEEKANRRFADVKNESLKFVVSSVENFDISTIEERVDYIIHGASQTASREFAQHPVETINTAVEGTRNMLELARVKNVAGFVYLSSMEVYGYPQKGHKVRENEIGAFSPLNLRNSYPVSKILCESMCAAYGEEYGVPTRICRLTQTFGPGVSETDNRIFAYFGRCVQRKENIVLKTAGDTERCYLYTTDAVTAILTILLKGENGAAYNAADESTYCSIAEMARSIAENNGIAVEFDIQPPSVNGYPETLYMDLDTTALRKLGWHPIGEGIRLLK